MTQQYATFWGVGTGGESMTPKFKFGQYFCTMHPSTKFHHPTFNRLEVIVLTNKQTDKQMPLKRPPGFAMPRR